MNSSRQISDARELVGIAELTDVNFYKLYAEAEQGLTATLPVMEIELNESHDFLMVRMNLSMSTEHANYAVDAVVTYEYQEPVTFDENVRSEFIEKAAIMALYPFLREAIVDLASKLRHPLPILGLLRPGDIHINQSQATANHDEPVADASAINEDNPTSGSSDL